MTSVFVILSLILLAKAQSWNGSVYYDSSTTTWKMVNVLDTNAVAFGEFQDTLQSSGWGILKIQTNPTFSDDIQMFGAGFLEGALTQERIYQVRIKSENEFSVLRIKGI